MKKNKQAKFFCESCGSEVKKNDKTCPICGKFFASVKCPNCGRVGNTEEFATGCPSCGYAVRTDFSILTKRNRNNSKYNGDSSLPIWVYLILLILLGILIILLYSCLVK